ncbi:MAG: type VI secretion system-associated protein TagF [candidate division Zixibacteria bacterium]|nr:type VI secretion system-associated protein TagF [candidate division Zixibacteria bacterium]
MIGHSAPPAVGLFGKLPSHPDFVRLNASGPLPQALDQWFSEGLSAMRSAQGANWEEEFDRAAPFSFVFRHASEPQSALVGVCRAGRDQTGRRYPLAVFVTTPVDRGGRDLHLIPVAYDAFLRAAGRLLLNDCADGIDREKELRIHALSELAPQSSAEASADFARTYRNLAMKSFWEGILGDFADRRKYLIIKNLFGALIPLRGRSPEGIRAILRLPVARQPELSSFQAAIWLLFCRSVLGASALAHVGTFWHSDPGAINTGCVIPFGPPNPALFSAFFAQSSKNESLWDLERIAADQADRAKEALGGPILAALDSPTYLVQDFLERL